MQRYTSKNRSPKTFPCETAVGWRAYNRTKPQFTQSQLRRSLPTVGWEADGVHRGNKSPNINQTSVRGLPVGASRPPWVGGLTTEQNRDSHIPNSEGVCRPWVGRQMGYIAGTKARTSAKPQCAVCLSGLPDSKHITPRTFRRAWVRR